MKKFSLHVVDSNTEFDRTSADFNEVVEAAFVTIETDDLEYILKMLISGLNEELYSDSNWFIVTDSQLRKIIMQ